MTEIDTFIKQHYTEDLSEEEIAGHVGLSTAYFSRNFHHIFGVTFSQYICSLRLKKAYEDIITTNHSIAYISEMAGFTSYPLFQTKFKAAYGCTPSECRKKYSQQFMD